MNEISRAIGRNVASLIPDGATVQFGLGRMPGFGRIPHAAIEFLKEKKDLGIHSEIITDSIIDLIESGAVTGARKSSDRGRIVVSFCMGTRRLYDTVNNNPLFCFRPTEYVNDSIVISQQTKMVAINMAQEIDLTGQVCTDSQEGMFYSGIGGLVDFNRGAARSKDGKTIVVIPSTDIARATARISSPSSVPGSGVVDHPRHHSLCGHRIRHCLSVWQKHSGTGHGSLISIAHPNFREQLCQGGHRGPLYPAGYGRYGSANF